MYALVVSILEMVDLNRRNEDWWGSCCESVIPYRKPLKDLKLDRENWCKGLPL